MGLFSFLFGKKQTKSYAQQLAEQQETKWYYENSSNVFRELLNGGNEELLEAGVNLFCTNLIESFDNIKRLKQQEKRVDTYIIASELAKQISQIIKDNDGVVALQCFYISSFIKNENNSLINFAKNLNHNFYGQSAFYIVQLLLLGHINEKDAWLYEQKLFNYDAISDDEEGKGLLNQLIPILSEKNLYTKEIMNEIENNIN